MCTSLWRGDGLFAIWLRGHSVITMTTKQESRNIKIYFIIIIIFIIFIFSQVLWQSQQNSLLQLHCEATDLMGLTDRWVGPGPSRPTRSYASDVKMWRLCVSHEIHCNRYRSQAAKSTLITWFKKQRILGLDRFFYFTNELN